MSHDELLAEISLTSRGEYASLAVALIAVVELHKPVMGFTGEYDGEENELWEEQCQECSGNGFSQMYPCPTIQAIKKELQ